MLQHFSELDTQKVRPAPLRTAQSSSGLSQSWGLSPAGINHGPLYGRAWRLDHRHQKPYQVQVSDCQDWGPGIVHTTC